MNHYQQAAFLLSVVELKQLPPDQGIEVAFIGRSNSGKSSVLNKITRNKNLARVSKTPGRTQMLNFFALSDNKRLVDLPGYGFARVADAVRERWVETLGGYFQTRASLRGLILVMDIRHPLQALDVNILEASELSRLPIHILLNKVDKLTKNQIRQTELMVRKNLEPYGERISFQIFSAANGTGVHELQAVLDRWFL